MNKQFNYPVKFLKQKEGGVLIRFPDFPEAITQADSKEEAFREAIDCLEEAIANRIEMKLDIPNPSSIKRGQHRVLFHVIFAAKLALYLALRERKITNTALAEKLDCDEKEIRRLLNPHYCSKLPRIEQALWVLGKRLQIEIVACDPC